MLSKLEEKYWQEITQLVAPSGAENNVAAYLKNEFENLGFDIVTDNLGSIFALKKSKNPDAKRVMVVGHMDEVGFYLARILDNGVCKCTPVGGFNASSLQSNRVIALNNKGEEIRGCIDTTPPYLLGSDEQLKPKDMLFDFGFKCKKDVLNAGLNIGSPIVCEGKFEYSFDKESIISKAIDDRYGIILGLELLHELKDVELPFDLYVGGSVQEEVGCRGAQTCAYKINPDLCIVLDVSPAKDSLGSSGKMGDLGEGVLLRFLDRTMIANDKLLDLQKAACEATNSKYQYFESPGGTDAGAIHKTRDGIVTLTHCICARSIHTPSTLMRISDYEAARNSLIYLVKNLTNETIKSLQGKAL